MGTVGGKLLGADREGGRMVKFDESTGRYARSHCTVECFKVEVSSLRRQDGSGEGRLLRFPPEVSPVVGAKSIMN